MKAQNSDPMMVSIATRTPRPFRSLTDRARAVSSLGLSRCSSVASDSCPATRTPAVGVIEGSRRSGIEHFDEIPHRLLAREPEEDLLEPSAFRAGAQVAHRAARGNPPAHDDRDAIAQRF